MEQPLSRNVIIYGDITTEKIEQVIQQLMDIIDFDEFMDKESKTYEPEPIKIMICSAGGEVTPTIGLTEVIKNSPTPIVTICLGEACSAAFMILISGHWRVAVKGSSIMSHQMAGGYVGSAKDCKIHFDQMNRVESYMIDLMKEQTKIAPEIVDEIYSSQIDKFFTVEECMQYGIIDQIYGEEPPEEIEEEDSLEPAE